MKNKLVISILKYIDENINSKISLEELSRIFYFNKDYIMRVFKKELGITIIEYINKKRVFASLTELKETNDSILKVALLNGFISQEYFSEIFTKTIGTNPHNYRKFTRNDPSLSYENIITIRKNLTELRYQLDKITKYCRNVSIETVKKLSKY